MLAAWQRPETSRGSLIQTPMVHWGQVSSSAQLRSPRERACLLLMPTPQRTVCFVTLQPASPQGSLSLKGDMVHTASLPVDIPTCASPDLQPGDLLQPRGHWVSRHLPGVLARRLAHSRRSKKARWIEPIRGFAACLIIHKCLRHFH